MAVFLCSAAPAHAQSDVPAAPPPVPEQAPSTPPPSLKTLFRDTMIDFKHLSSSQTITWVVIGAAGSLASHTEDASLTANLSRGGRLHSFFESGNVIGSVPFQVGGAVAAYAAGRLTHNDKAIGVGLDLLQAQAVAQTTTFAIKYSTQRTRPDGGAYSFPSGHTSIAFASATVLQDHFGWKAGVPAFAAASYVAAARVENRRHFLSDITFGAALGILSARAVTIGRGPARFGVTPLSTPAGGGVALTWLHVP